MERFKFIPTSIYLDFLMLTGNFLTLSESLEFMFKKYYLILKHLLVHFKLSESYIKLHKRNFYYDSKYGIAGLQGSFTRHYLELKSLHKKKIETVFDIGANVGTFTLLCNKLFKSKIIYSFEPIPLTYKCLMNNCSDFKNIKTFNLAFSDKKGVAKMSFNRFESFISSFNSLKKGNSLIQVKTETLNNFVKEYNIDKIDLLKIDVESFENLVLIGASNVLKNVRYLLIEITINQNKNYTISSLFSLLIGSGYNFQLIHFRNSNDKSYGKVDWMDCLLENIDFKS